MRPVTTAPSTTTFSDLPVEPTLSEAAAEAWIPRTFFKNGPPHRVGLELEFLVAGTGDDALATHYPHEQYPHLIDRLIDGPPDSPPGGGLDGRVTVEPGGRSSSAPAPVTAWPPRWTPFITTWRGCVDAPGAGALAWSGWGSIRSGLPGGSPISLATEPWSGTSGPGARPGRR